MSRLAIVLALFCLAHAVSGFSFRPSSSGERVIRPLEVSSSLTNLVELGASVQQAPDASSTDASGKASDDKMPRDGMLVYFRSDDLTNGATWKDQSGNDYHATAWKEKGVTAPIVVTVTNNKKRFPIMRFTAAQGMELNHDALSVQAPCTIVVVDRYTPNAKEENKGRTFTSKDQNWAFPLYNKQRRYYAGDPPESGGFVDDPAQTGLTSADTMSFAVSVATLAPTPGDPNTFEANWYYNGKKIATKTSGGFKAPGKIALGAAGSQSGQGSDADIATVAVYSKALAEDDIMKLTWSLSVKFGIKEPRSNIKKCLRDNGGCDVNTVSCTNDASDAVNGNVTCGECKKGFKEVPNSNPRRCTDIDECADKSHTCHTLTQCINTPGSFSCTDCPKGYKGTGKNRGCTDIDECSSNNGGCDPLQVCQNSPGSYTCGPCPKGYLKVTPSRCVDINECSRNNGGCDGKTACMNIPGSRTCGPCPTGYTGTGETSCVDINECDTDNGGCHNKTRCYNSQGSRLCGACPDGYAGDGESGCIDKNECLVNNGGCDPRTRCENIEGGMKCYGCPEGYTGDGYKGCNDINECLVNNGGCFRMTICQNIPGSRICGPCPPGFLGNGVQCVDIDECMGDNGGCDPLTQCVNIPGGRQCGPCPAGFQGNGLNGCQDVDECKVNNGGCDPNVECFNIPGGRLCGGCPAGFLGDGYTGCIIDIRHMTRSIVTKDGVLYADNSGARVKPIGEFTAGVISKTKEYLGNAEADAKAKDLAKALGPDVVNSIIKQADAIEATLKASPTAGATSAVGAGAVANSVSNSNTAAAAGAAAGAATILKTL